MAETKILQYETIPCWYELSFKGVNGRSGLLLRIHSEFAEWTRKIAEDLPVVMRSVRRFDFNEFSGVFGEDLGFERCLKYIRTEDGFLEYEIPTPRVKNFKKEPCDHCNGRGFDEAMGRDCLRCEKGRVPYYDWDAAYAISASLSVLFFFMSYPETETMAIRPQLMHLDVSAVKGSRGGALTGVYSRELVDYLRTRLIGEIPEMVQVMRTVWVRMEGGIPGFYAHSFRAYIKDPARLIVECPGDIAKLRPEHDFMGDLQGYEFTCHGLDNPLQQLTLLAALAELHDLARATGR